MEGVFISRGSSKEFSSFVITGSGFLNDKHENGVREITRFSNS